MVTKLKVVDKWFKCLVLILQEVAVQLIQFKVNSNEQNMVLMKGYEFI